MYFQKIQKIPKEKKKFRRLNGIRSEKKNPKTGRNPQKRAKAWWACSIARHKHRYIFIAFFLPVFPETFFCVKVRFTRFSVLYYPKKPALWNSGERFLRCFFFFIFIQ